jgi:hypothetical protein
MEAVAGEFAAIHQEFSGNSGISQDHTCMAFLIVL